MLEKGDFHLHTTASDGKLSPSSLVALGKNKNLSLLSITDHDTTRGVEEAKKAGKEIGVSIIPGIELSTTHNEENIHILGYFKDDSYTSMNFQDFLTEIVEDRVIRGKKIIENLYTYFQIKLDAEEVLSRTKGVFARPHIAKAILDAGYNYSWDYIFDKIIGKDSPAYIPTKRVTIEEGIAILKSVNAIVVLAHPVLIKKSDVSDLMNYDFDGLEAIYSLNTPKDTEKFVQIAKRYEKLITAGSDFHGIEDEEKRHGDIGEVSLQGELLKKFLEMLK